MPVACFVGRGKVHGSLAAVGTTVDSDPFWVVVEYENMISKVYTSNKKVQHQKVLDFFVAPRRPWKISQI